MADACLEGRAALPPEQQAMVKPRQPRPPQPPAAQVQTEARPEANPAQPATVS
jgi:small subunit ribosomal protein S2